MGRWTPLILMAGGLAILLGTLLGINFPMGTQTANNPNGKAAKVLPANINVNSNAGSRNNDDAATEETQATQGTQSTETRRSVAAPRTDNTSSVAQNPSGTPDSTTDSNTDTSTDTSTDTNQNNEPIRALW